MRGTPGQAKIAETTLRNPLVIQPERGSTSLRDRIRAHDGDFLLLKHWFDVFTNENVDLLLEVLAPQRVVLYGVALDVCDRYALDGLLQRLPAGSLTLVEDATRAIDAGAGRALVDGWRAAGVRVVTVADVLAGRALQ
jgi:nicotinamidase-related amidase